MVAATIAPIRRPFPGTQMERGVRGREHIVAYFGRQVPIRVSAAAAISSPNFATQQLRMAPCYRPRQWWTTSAFS